MERENVLFDKAYAFAIRVVKAYQFLSSDKKEFVLSKQLLRSGTSIGANVAEATGGISKADFSAKLSIAYKECLETKYWLSLLKDTKFIDENSFQSIFEDADEIGKILFSIIKTSKKNNNRTLANFSFVDNIQRIASSSRGIVKWIKNCKFLILLYLWTHRKDELHNHCRCEERSDEAISMFFKICQSSDNNKF